MLICTAIIEKYPLIFDIDEKIIHDCRTDDCIYNIASFITASKRYYGQISQSFLQVMISSGSMSAVKKWPLLCTISASLL